MTVDAFASERHYLDHVAAVWQAIPEADRGTLYAGVPKGGHGRAVELGLDHRPCRVPPVSSTPILVASYGDERACAGRPIALLEHGAGQHYGGRRDSTADSAFAGGPGRDDVGLFLCPNPAVAERNAATYPAARIEVVGAPRLARFLRRRPCSCPPWSVDAGCEHHGDGTRYSRLSQQPPRPVVAVSFHWDCQTWPESRSAFEHYRPALRLLSGAFAGVVGHSHPRIWGRAARAYLDAGVPIVPHFDDVCDFADVYVVDNSSTLFEFAALDRPVVVLNAPWYRRDVEHGLRFWEHAGVGVNVDEPSGLVDAIEAALVDGEPAAFERRRVVDAVFPGPPVGPPRDAADGYAAAALVAWAETVTG